MARTSIRKTKLAVSFVGCIDVPKLVGNARGSRALNVSKKSPRLLFVVTEDWYFVSHRLSLAIAASKAGFDVSVATRVKSHGTQIKVAGIRLVPIKLLRKSGNLFWEIKSIIDLVNIYRRERPDIVHHVAMKPVLYGSFAAWIARVDCVVNTVAGMGYVFVSTSIVATIMRFFIKMFFKLFFSRKNTRVIVQNSDDLDFFRQRLSINASNLKMIRGSGVDLEEFKAFPESPPSPVVVVLPARMLWDKGVGEFVEAAGMLHRKGVNARFVLVGGFDEANPAAVPMARLAEWSKTATVEWWGHCEDMADIYAKSHIVCLPSYREGLPKALLEAAACSRPIVATDVPGCREIVVDGYNGLLVPMKDSLALANALFQLISDGSMRNNMGNNGRKLVETEFSDEKVFDATINLYKNSLISAKIHYA